MADWVYILGLIITGLFVIAGNVITARKSRSLSELNLTKNMETLENSTAARLDHMHSQTSSKIDQLDEKTSIKIDNLTKKVDKHNHIVERMYSLEANFADEKEVCNRRFDIIEHALPRTIRKENKEG